MFNDRYGLTAAVLSGKKTMTRRFVTNVNAVQRLYELYDDDKLKGPDASMFIEKYSKYQIDEVVAVAQSYKSIHEEMMNGDYGNSMYDAFRCSMVAGIKGWNNKTFVRADLMPHQIKITDIKIERLHDISDEDCFKEGIIPITWRQYLKQDFDDLSPQKYIDHNVYTLEKFREGIEDCWAESDPNEFMAEEAKVAFAVLINKINGKDTWNSAPFVFVYSFKLIKK